MSGVHSPTANRFLLSTRQMRFVLREKFLVIKYWIIFLLNITIKIKASVMSTPRDYKLELVQVLFRHGARTYALGEGSLVRPQDLDESIIATYGYFELTNIGKTQLYEFGRALRERYGGFLGDVYRPHELYARTTDTSRTKMSLMLLLAGLFPPTTKQAWNTELKWTPIPFDYLPTELDLLLKPFEKARYKQQLEEVLKFPELQEKTNQLFESTKFLGDMGISGIKREGYHGAMGILNVISCHKSANASLPEWYTEDLYASFKEYAKLNLDIMVWNTELKKYAIGPLIKTFLQNMNIDNKVSNPRKIYLYSAHEMNVAAFTRAHKIESYRYPEYGSAVILEKFRDATGQLFVRMVYWTGVGGKYKVLKLRGHEYCPINEYINLVKSVTPTDEEINSMYKELKVDANRFHTTDFVFQSNNGL